MGDAVTSEMTIGSRPSGWTETWKSPAGFSSYEASDDSVWTTGEDGKPVQVTGGIRSVDRTVRGRSYQGRMLKARIMANSGGYAALDVTDDQGVKRTMLVHRFILLAHVGECPPGMETRHLVNDPLDCRWAPGETAEEVMANGGNIMYGKPADQFGDQVSNGSRRRAEPKPDKHCLICGDVFTTPGQRCHLCVVDLGKQATELYWEGIKPDRAAKHLGYPSPDGLVWLAVRYGGYGRPPLIWRLRRKLTQRKREAGHGAPPRPDSPKGGDPA
jgi:hypothetical protein